MKNNIFSLFILVVLTVFITGCSDNNNSSSFIHKIDDNPDKIVIYFFYGDGCPHCADEKPFLQALDYKYEEVEVKMFETWNDRNNANLFQQISNVYDAQVNGVPATFIGDEYWVGFAKYMSEEMEDKVIDCIDNGCENPGTKLLKTLN